MDPIPIPAPIDEVGLLPSIEAVIVINSIKKIFFIIPEYLEF